MNPTHSPSFICLVSSGGKLYAAPIRVHCLCSGHEVNLRIPLTTAKHLQLCCFGKQHGCGSTAKYRPVDLLDTGQLLVPDLPGAIHPDPITLTPSGNPLNQRGSPFYICSLVGETKPQRRLKDYPLLPGRHGSPIRTGPTFEVSASRTSERLTALLKTPRVEKNTERPSAEG